MIESQDPFGDPYTPTQSSGPTFDVVNAAYQKWLGRPLSQAEYQQYWAGVPNFNEGMIANSSEGLALANKNVPGQSGYDPNVPIAPGNETGQRPPTNTDVPGPTQTSPTGTPPPVTNGPVDTYNIDPGPKLTPNPTGSTTGPTFNGPTYTPPPAATTPTPFAYDPFHAPTADDVLGDPEYQLKQKMGTQALNQSAAARGVLNTGGTLKDIINYSNDLASSAYGDLYNRKFNEWNSGYQNALNAYKTNTGLDADTRNFNYTSQYTDPFNFGMQRAAAQYGAQQHNYDQNQYYGSHNNDLDRMYAWNKYIQDYNEKRNGKLDDFEMRYRVLGLL